MATKKPAAVEAAPAAEVTISRTALSQLVEVVEALEKADKAYMPCQGNIYRQYAQGLYKALTTQQAVKAAKEALA